MENTDDPEKSMTVGDSAYSYSCSNSKSTRSSKSTLSGSNSSGSSGYRGKRVNTDYNKTNNAPPEKRARDEVKIVELNLNGDEVENEAQSIIEFEKPPSSNEDAHHGIIDAVYLTPPQATCGELVRETDIMDVSISEKSAFQDSNGFFCVISMQDGVVMYTTMTISSVLGFPPDMWVGRSFTDFIHPNDRDVFVSHVSDDLILWKKVNASHLEKKSSTMLCRIRRHKELSSGFAIRERKAVFKPFILKIFFKNIIEDDVIYLVIHAMAFTPAFKTSNEKVINPIPFVIKHSVSGNLEYMDQESVPYLGYFPQDVEDKNKDLVDMYHPADLIYLRHVYEILLNVGSHERCKPYRIQAYNGDYVKIESEWISYVHPWSKKLECIIGKHYVVEGPTNPNIFESPEVTKPPSYEEEEGETANSKILRESIKRLLSQAVIKPKLLAKEQMSKRSRDIAAYMDYYIYKVKTVPKADEREDMKTKTDSIKLGGLSSHTGNDSKSSTDTSISYDRLNYDETLQRYFDSHARCLANGYTDDLNLLKWKESSPENGASTSGTQTSTVRDMVLDCMSNSSSSSCSSITAPNHNVRLTESLLNKHNEKMEKNLVKIRRKSKSTTIGQRVTDVQKMNEHLERCNVSFQPTLLNIERLKANKRRRVRYTANMNQKCAADNARMGPNPAILPSPWQANQENSINTFLMGVGISQQKSLMNAITMPAPPVPLYYSTPLQTSEVPANADQEKEMIPGKQDVPYMMYEQGDCEPYTYSPVNHLPQKLDETCMGEYKKTRPRSGESNPDSTDASQRQPKKKFKMSNSEGTVNTDGESSFSSFYSSFFKTESGSTEDNEEAAANKDDGKFWRRKLLLDDTSSKDSKLNGHHAKRRMQPPWLEQVRVTPELIYQYQIATKNKEEVLSADREKLTKLKQPKMVCEQLGQLYLDLQLEGVTSRLTLEEGITSSSSGEENTTQSTERRRSTGTRRRRDYNKMSILYDEDAPLPPADDATSSSAT